MVNERPCPMNGYLVWQALADAIRRGTALKPFGGESSGGPWEGGNAPASAQHRTFQVEPQGKTYLGRMSDDDILIQKRTLLVTVRHDYRPGDHDASWQEADSDFEAMEDALLTRVEGLWCQLELGAATARRQGHTLVQTLTVTTTYERPLPLAQE